MDPLGPNNFSIFPISKNLDEFSVKQDIEKFLRGVQLKAFFFHDKEDDSNTSDASHSKIEMDSLRGPVRLFRFFHQ